MGKYDGKLAVVTGGSTGIGFATAKLLVSEGATVVITARSQAALDAAAKELGPNVVPVVSDASRLGDIDTLASKIGALGKKIDLLFFNAGIAKFAPLEQTTETLYDEILDINTKGAYFTVQKLAPHLRDGGSIVFNTSVADEKGMATSSVYSASKAALRSLARTFASELLGRGIRVNAVSPGPITTPIFSKSGLPEEVQQAFASQIKEQNPMKRFGNPEEVAKAALFLGFDATYTTGAELPVDGGVTQL